MIRHLSHMTLTLGRTFMLRASGHPGVPKGGAETGGNNCDLRHARTRAGMGRDGEQYQRCASLDAVRASGREAPSSPTSEV
jgi:hypothetical protein